MFALKYLIYRLLSYMAPGAASDERPEAFSWGLLAPVATASRLCFGQVGDHTSASEASQELSILGEGFLGLLNQRIGKSVRPLSQFKLMILGGLKLQVQLSGSVTFAYFSWTGFGKAQLCSSTRAALGASRAQPGHRWVRHLEKRRGFISVPYEAQSRFL